MAINLTCIISPHIDDACLSLSETILDHDLGDNIIVLNVFTLTNYLYLGHKNRDKEFNSLSLATSTRMNEELEFSRLLYHRSINYLPFFLGFKDAGLEEDVYIREERNSYFTNRIKKIQLIPQLRKFLDNFQEIEALLFPVGLGNHLDHITLRKASEFFKDQYKTWFYADIPYANKYNSITDVKKVLQMPKKTRSVKKFVPEAKVSLFKDIYKSQYYPAIENDMVCIARNLGGEILFR